MALDTDVGDLRRRARRNIPGWIFDYADAGSFSEETMQNNRQDFRQYKFRQRVMVDVSQRSLATKIVGENITAPFGLAPTGLAGFFHPSGEIHAAQAAEAAGVPFCLSTVSICSIEEVAAATTKPFWFQIYIMRDRGFTRSLLERAWQAGCRTLVLTMDLPLQAQRHKDVKNGLTIPPKMTAANIAQMIAHPRWSLGILAARRFGFGNFRDVPGLNSMSSYASWVASSFDPAVTWRDLEWLRSVWAGKIILKGIMDSADAAMAVRVAADGIVVSNHGGRQLDGAPSSISMLPHIVDTVRGRTDILFDSGIMSGQDIVRALALGAQCCLLGKAYLYGLAAGGRKGIDMLFAMLRREMDVTLALTGVSSVRDLNPSIFIGSGLCAEARIEAVPLSLPA